MKKTDEEIEILDLDEKDLKKEDKSNKKVNNNKKNIEKKETVKSKSDSNKKAMKKFNVFITIIGIIYLIIYIIFMYFLLKLDAIPNKFLIPIIIITIIISAILIGCLFNKKIKKKIRITSLVFTIILSIIYSAGSYYIYYTISFMKNIKTDNSQIEKYYVVVKKDSSFNKISDIKNEDISVLKSGDSVYEKAKDKLYNKVEVIYKDKSSIKKLYNDIKNDKIIFVSNSIYSILSEKPYNLDEMSKIIYTVKVKTKVKDITKTVDVSNKAFNVYISGIDTTGSISNVARSDVNMVVTVNPTTHKVLMTSIPRDYYVMLHSYQSKDKLTHSGIYGINESVTTIEDLLDIDINYYVRVNFSTVTNLVDVIGGITVNSEYSFTTHGMGKGKKYSFVAGENYLNGEQALAFSRERKSFKDGDRQRIKNQQLVLSAIIGKVSSSTTILEKYASILNTMSDSIQTNMGQEEMSKLVKNQINEMPNWEISKCSLTGYDSRNVTYTNGNQMLYVMEPDIESIENAKKLINEMENY